LELAPQVWLNWQLLGNYLSDLKKFDEAQSAYDSALECEAVLKDSIYLNQAILLDRVGKYSSALKISKQIKDEEFHIRKTEIEIGALIELDLIEEAMKLANQVLSIENYPDKDAEAVGGIAAQLGQIYLKQGKPKDEVRTFALHSLSSGPTNGRLLALIREIDSLYSEKAKYFRAVIHCIISRTSPLYKDTKGYYCTYDVIAESTDQLLSFVKEFEESVVPEGSYTIDEYEVLEENSKDPCGVYWKEGRTFYSDVE